MSLAHAFNQQLGLPRFLTLHRSSSSSTTTSLFENRWND